MEEVVRKTNKEQNLREFPEQTELYQSAVGSMSILAYPERGNFIKSYTKKAPSSVIDL